MKDIGESMVLLFIGTILGIALGIARNDENWKKDCDAIGAHRVDGKVYECRKVTK